MWLPGCCYTVVKYEVKYCFVVTRVLHMVSKALILYPLLG